MRKERINLFMLYSPDDLEEVEEVREAILNVGIKLPFNLIKFDNDTFVKFSPDDFDAYLKQADVVLLMVSKSFLSSDLYISESVQAYIESPEKYLTPVIPIILKRCFWEESRLRKLPPLPMSGLPISENTRVRELIFRQIAEHLAVVLKQAGNKRQENARYYNLVLSEADRLFENREENAEDLSLAADLYEKAIAVHQAYFRPELSVLTHKLDVCKREVDFRYYATAVENAYKLKDYKGVIYHAKNALNLRDDARIQKLSLLAKNHIHSLKKEEREVPFRAQIELANRAFLEMDWKKSAEEYLSALDFYEDGFIPEKDFILRKVDLCNRELHAEIYTAKAEKALEDYKYNDSLIYLESALKGEHPAIVKLANRTKYLIDQLLNIRKFYDETSRLWGYFDTRTDIVIIPPRYEDAYHFSEHLAGVKKNGKWGFIDIEGNTVVSFIYDFVTHFKDGKSEVYLFDEKIQINRKGEKI